MRHGYFIKGKFEPLPSAGTPEMQQMNEERRSLYNSLYDEAVKALKESEGLAPPRLEEYTEETADEYVKQKEEHKRRVNAWIVERIKPMIEEEAEKQKPTPEELEKRRQAAAERRRLRDEQRAKEREQRRQQREKERQEKRERAKKIKEEAKRKRDEIRRLREEEKKRKKRVKELQAKQRALEKKVSKNKKKKKPASPKQAQNDKQPTTTPVLDDNGDAADNHDSQGGKE